MPFIRIKKIRKKDKIYSCAYLVENKWRKRLKGGKKGSRQKVKAYLGRIYEYPKVNETDFIEHYSIDDLKEYVNKDYSKIIIDLVLWEFHTHNINKDDFEIDFNKKIVNRNKRKAVIMMNEGFLCSHTLRNLMNFKIKEDEKIGYVFAKTIVEAGVDVPEELFVKIFEKITML